MSQYYSKMADLRFSTYRRRLKGVSASKRKERKWNTLTEIALEFAIEPEYGGLAF